MCTCNKIELILCSANCSTKHNSATAVKPIRDIEAETLLAQPCHCNRNADTVFTSGTGSHFHSHTKFGMLRLVRERDLKIDAA